MYDVKESLLRYWEGVFPHLKPQTTSNNVRQYTQKDIDQIGLIYNLVKVRGFKLAAARKMLNENRSGVDKKGDGKSHRHTRGVVAVEETTRRPFVMPGFAPYAAIRTS